MQIEEDDDLYQILDEEEQQEYELIVASPTSVDWNTFLTTLNISNRISDAILKTEQLNEIVKQSTDKIQRMYHRCMAVEQLQENRKSVQVIQRVFNSIPIHDQHVNNDSFIVSIQSIIRRRNVQHTFEVSLFEYYRKTKDIYEQKVNQLQGEINLITNKHIEQEIIARSLQDQINTLEKKMNRLNEMEIELSHYKSAMNDVVQKQEVFTTSLSTMIHHQISTKKDQILQLHDQVSECQNNLFQLENSNYSNQKISSNWLQISWLLVLITALFGPLGAYFACKYLLNKQSRALGQAFWTIVPFINVIVWLDLVLLAKQQLVKGKSESDNDYVIGIVKKLPLMQISQA
jgi:hypothetical protein